MRPTLRLHFEPWEGVGFGGGDFDAEGETLIKGGLRRTLECGTVCTGGGGFDFEVQFGEGAVMKHVHAVLHDFWERCEHVLDCGRVDVHAAYDDHVVGSSEDTPMQEAVLRRCRRADEIARAVAEDWPVEAAERREDEFAGFARCDGEERVGMNDFGEVTIGKNVECVGASGGEEGGGPNFGHAVVIEQAGVGPKVGETVVHTF